MMCYRDRSYCVDADTCMVPKHRCDFALTDTEANRAEILGLPIAFMSFKDTCLAYVEKPCPQLQQQ